MLQSASCSDHVLQIMYMLRKNIVSLAWWNIAQTRDSVSCPFPPITSLKFVAIHIIGLFSKINIRHYYFVFMIDKVLKPTNAAATVLSLEKNSFHHIDQLLEI